MDTSGSESVTVVTGAAGVLGAAVVDRFNRAGHITCAVDLNTVSGCEPTHVFEGVDLSDAAQLKQTRDAIVSKAGRITNLVNVAGGFTWETFQDSDLSSWKRMWDLNLNTAVNMTSSCLPAISASKGGIVMIGAAATRVPGAGMAPYAASKAGLQVFTESLAREMAGSGVRVNAVLPSIIDTPTNRKDIPDADTAQWIPPSDLADVIRFLLSDAARSVSGALIPVTRGY